MKATATLFACLSIMIALAGSGCSSIPFMGPYSSSDINGADMLDEAYVAAFNRGDADAMEALYADSLDTTAFTMQAGVLRERDAIVEHAEAFFQANPGAKLELTERHNTVVADDAVLGWGFWRITIPAADGGADQVLTGRYSDVKVKQDDTWLYVHEHISVPTAP